MYKRATSSADTNKFIRDLGLTTADANFVFLGLLRFHYWYATATSNFIHLVSKHRLTLEFHTVPPREQQDGTVHRKYRYGTGNARISGNSSLHVLYCMLCLHTRPFWQSRGTVLT